MGVALWMLSRAEEFPAEFRASPYEREVARELRHFWVILRDAEGRVIWRLFGKRVLIKRNGDYLLEGVQEGYYYRHGEPWLKVQAERAEYEAQSRDVVVSGQVRVEALKEEMLFEAERVEWRQREQTLSCPQVKHLQYRQYRLETAGPIVYHLEGREVRCPQPLRVEGEGELLEAQSLTVNLREKVWRLMGPGRIVRWILAGSTLVALLPGGAKGQPAAPEQVQPKKRRVEIHYEKMVEWREEKGVMEGVVIALPEDEVTLYADRVEYDGKEEIAQATGHLRMVDPENVLTGKRILVYVKERRAVVEGEVRMVHTPKEAQKKEATPSEKKEKGERLQKYREEVTLLTCDRLEYFYRRPRKAIASGRVRFEQPRVGRFATAEKGYYFEETDTVRLVGNVKAQDEKGQTFAGPEIELGVKEEWVRAKGPGQIVLYVEEEEEETSPPPAQEGKPAPPPSEGEKKGE